MTTPREFVGTSLRLEWPRPRVGLVTFTRPGEMNSVSLEMLSELRYVLDAAREHGAAAVVLIGEGRAFCAGAHLKLFLDKDKPIGSQPAEWCDRYIRPMAELFDSFEKESFPIIAAINGYALGGGAEMALSADFRVMSRTAKFGLPETKLGALAAAGGVQKLVRHLGRSKALEWIILGRHIGADEMTQAGFLYAITEPEDLLATSLKLADEIARLSPSAVSCSKRAIYFAEDVELQSARRFAVESLEALMSTAEWREGVESFLQKRQPKFTELDDAERSNAHSLVPREAIAT